MRFKNRVQSGKMPQVNLIPMLNVMMGILAFFVMITMMLTNEQGVEVQLPAGENAPPPDDEPPPVLVVELNAQGQFFVEEEPFEQQQLESQLRLFLRRDEEAFVVLQADETLPYERVLQTLAELKAIGGDRVSLGIE
ncbi:MAG: biopolymer transporter ExbD [Cyanobacteria bacterium J06638_20]